jgi:hypothetical protein
MEYSVQEPITLVEECHVAKSQNVSVMWPKTQSSGVQSHFCLFSEFFNINFFDFTKINSRIQHWQK